MNEKNFEIYDGTIPAKAEKQVDWQVQIKNLQKAINSMNKQLHEHKKRIVNLEAQLELAKKSKR